MCSLTKKREFKTCPVEIAGTRWAHVGIWRWPNVGYPRWANLILFIDPTLVQLVDVNLSSSNVGLYYTSVDPMWPMWLLHVYVVFSLGQRGSVLYFQCSKLRLFIGGRRFKMLPSDSVRQVIGPTRPIHSGGHGRVGLY